MRFHHCTWIHDRPLERNCGECCWLWRFVLSLTKTQGTRHRRLYRRYKAAPPRGTAAVARCPAPAAAPPVAPPVAPTVPADHSSSSPPSPPFLLGQ